MWRAHPFVFLLPLMLKVHGMGRNHSAGIYTTVSSSSRFCGCDTIVVFSLPHNFKVFYIRTTILLFPFLFSCRSLLSSNSNWRGRKLLRIMMSLGVSKGNSFPHLKLLGSVHSYGFPLPSLLSCICSDVSAQHPQCSGSKGRGHLFLIWDRLQPTAPKLRAFVYNFSIREGIGSWRAYSLAEVLRWAKD